MEVDESILRKWIDDRSQIDDMQNLKLIKTLSLYFIDRYDRVLMEATRVVISMWHV